jgi:nucleoside-diphosphate-sugar epimerase
MPCVLIVGCGYVGKALATEYLAYGYEVFALQRNPVDIPGVKNLISDVTEVLLNNIPIFDTVFYLVSAGQSSDEAYEKAYVKGINHLLKQLPTHSNTRVIYISSTGVFAQQQGEWVDENSETLPTDFSGKRLLEGEKLVKNSGFSHVIVRLGGIYGEGRTRIIEQVKNHEARLTPTPCYTNRIHLDDCVGILSFLAKHPSPPSLVLGVDCKPVLYNELLLWLANQLSLPEPLLGEIPTRLQKSNKRCKNQALTALGYEYHYSDYQVGLAALLKSDH